MSLIEIDGLDFRYPESERNALKNVSLAVQPGEFVVVAGGSGSGKSSLLRAMNGLVPHFHGGEFGGTVRVAGLCTRTHGPGGLARVVGSLFQDPETQIVLGSARAELSFPLENRGLDASTIARAVEETALALAIDHLLDRPTAELSGGELQRVALGATLVGAPSVVCLDEPTSQLDPVAGDELLGLLRRLHEDRDLTVVIAEHRLERCLALADRVIAMDDGRVAFDGGASEFLRWAMNAAPALVTPGARLLAGLGLPPVPGVRAARRTLRDHGLDPSRVTHLEAVQDPAPAAGPSEPAIGSRGRFAGRRTRRHDDDREAVVTFDDVWHEIPRGAAILRGMSLSVVARDRVAVMGRNGAGKSTALRHAAGLMKPTRGTVRVTGRVALLLQNPNDYLVHETVEQEASRSQLVRFGLEDLGGRHPRDLSGGERQRLALAIVLGTPDGFEPPSVVCLDEPTRGMDRAVKAELARLLRELDCAVVVATHDPEFAAAFSERVLLVADGGVIADGPTREILSGGTYFATETARIFGGAHGALLPEDGVRALLPAEAPSVEGVLR